MSEDEARDIIARDPRNAEVLSPYVNGDDLNSRPKSDGSRWIVNFGEMSEAQARTYAGPWAWIEERVKPERMTKDGTKYPRMVNEWWKYWNARPGLVAATTKLSHVLAITRVSKVVLPVRVPTGPLFSEQCVIFSTDKLADFALLSSAAHYGWAISYLSTLETRIRYTPSDVFETLARPQSTARMHEVGARLDEDRRRLMLGRQLGLTKIYNLVNDPGVLDAEVGHLRALHVEVDEAVRGAYGWDDLVLDHGHHDTRQGLRWTVSPIARAELLNR